MAFSSLGKVKLAAQALLFLVNIVVLAFAVRVNTFQEYFFVADLFPFSLSIVTLVLLFGTIILDLAMVSPATSLPPVEIGHFGALSILWLAFNSFSTSRWASIPSNCNSIPADFPDERVWCKDVQALKAFVWIEFLIFLGITVMTLRYTITQYNRGNRHIIKTSLLHFGNRAGMARNSEFLQYGEKLP